NIVYTWPLFCRCELEEIVVRHRDPCPPVQDGGKFPCGEGENEGDVVTAEMDDSGRMHGSYSAQDWCCSMVRDRSRDSGGIMTARALDPASVQLTSGVFDRRRRRNREYLVSLSERNLLQNHLIEAGIGDQAWHLHPSGSSDAERGLDRHWGWETPGSLLRGHFLGHWMSAAAREVAVSGDAVLRAKL